MTKENHEHAAAASQPQAEPVAALDGLSTYDPDYDNRYMQCRDQFKDGDYYKVEDVRAALAAPMGREAQAERKAALLDALKACQAVRNTVLIDSAAAAAEEDTAERAVEGCIVAIRKLLVQEATVAQGEQAAIDLLRKLLNSEVGKRTLWQLSDGIGTATDEGRAWLAAKALVDGTPAAAQGEQADEVRDAAAKVVLKLTAVPRDVLGPATTAMKDRAALGEKLAAAIRALKHAGDTCTDAARDVLAERRRQVEAEGWTPERDDGYTNRQLCFAAASYTLCNTPGSPPAMWSWPVAWWKPTNPRRNLVKAGALILAEIERIDRTERAGNTGEQADGGAR